MKLGLNVFFFLFTFKTRNGIYAEHIRYRQMCSDKMMRNLTIVWIAYGLNYSITNVIREYYNLWNFVLCLYRVHSTVRKRIGEVIKM